MDDVLIVGAGPVGLTLATELARFGVPVRVIDRSPHASEHSKALVIWSRTLELLDRAGCTPAFLDAGLRARATSMRATGRLLARNTFDVVASPYDFALMVPQSETERLLDAQLRSFGFAVERAVELTGFTPAASHVDVRIRHPDGREEATRTGWLIGCDGAHSTVRHGLGFQFQGATNDDDWLLADVRLDGDAAPPRDEIAIFFHRDGPFVVFPMPGGRTRIVAASGKAAAGEARPAPTLTDVQAMADERAGRGLRISDPVWLSNFRINERKVARYSEGRVFLAGDAAHVHSPAGGQGMNTGMQDAFNLAWKLGMVVRGEAGPGLLDSYSTERSAIGSRVVRGTTRITDLATLSNPLARTARNLALRAMLGVRAVRNRLVTAMSEIDIAYPDSALSSGRRAGERLSPHQYGGPPPGSGTAPRFVLHAADRSRGAALIARFPGVLEQSVRVSPESGRLLVIRPDGYVGLSAAADAWGRAERYVGGLAV